VGDLHRRVRRRPTTDAPSHPSSRASFRAHDERVVIGHLDHLVDHVHVQDARMKPAPAPESCAARLQLLPAFFCVMTGLVTGSTANDLHRCFAAFNTFAAAG